MKQTPFLLALLLSSTTTLLYAQLQPVATSTHTLTARVNLVKGQLERTSDTLNVLEGGSSFETDFLLDSLAIQSGELVVYYHLPERALPRAFSSKSRQIQEVNFAYNISLNLTLNGQPLKPEPQYLVGDIGAGITPRKGNNHFQIHWAHILQDYVNLQGELKASLRVEEYTNLLLWLNVNCEVSPSFNFEERLPYFLAGVVGGGLIALGVGEEISSQNIYDNKYANADNLREALPLYNKANNKHHNFIIFTTAGTVILLTDAVLYYRRSRQYKQEKNIFNQYCSDKPLTIDPVLGLPAGQSSGGQLGFRLAYTF